MTALEGTRVVAASCGPSHTMALTATGGEVYTWGSGRSGLGYSNHHNQRMPCKIEALQGVVGISAGRQHSAAWSKRGVVWTWGAGDRGQLGHGNADDQLVPVVVQALAGKKVVGVATGCSHTAAWTEAGELLTWGGNDSGQLGHGDEEMDVVYDEEEGGEGIPCLFLPRVVQALQGCRVVLAAAGGNSFHTVVNTDDGYDDGKLWGFGAGGGGQLGTGSRENERAPVASALY